MEKVVFVRSLEDLVQQGQRESFPLGGVFSPGGVLSLRGVFSSGRVFSLYGESFHQGETFL